MIAILKYLEAANSFYRSSSLLLADAAAAAAENGPTFGQIWDFDTIVGRKAKVFPLDSGFFSFSGGGRICAGPDC